MVIKFHRTFHKELHKLPPRAQEQTYERLQLFSLAPYDPLLHNHPLVGRYKGYFSININGDLRALYKLIDFDSVMFVKIGSHSTLYKK